MTTPHTFAGMTTFFHAMPGGTALLLTGLLSVTASAVAWWRDVIIESDMGMHTEVVKQNLMSGVWLFIVSEAVLFFGLLWSCVHLGEPPLGLWVTHTSDSTISRNHVWAPTLHLTTSPDHLT